jgi:hypothetical protein
MPIEVRPSIFRRKKVSLLALMLAAIYIVTSNVYAKGPPVEHRRKPSPRLATPIPRLQSAHLSLRRSWVVVVTKSGIQSFHISAVVRNSEAYAVSDVRVFLRGRGGLLLPMRGGRTVPARSEVVFYLRVRELYDPKSEVRCVITCRECSIRPVA